MFLVDFGPFCVQSGHSDVTKGAKILRFGTSDLAVGFIIPKTYHCQFLDQTNHFIVFDHGFGHFWAVWVQTGLSDVTKGVKILRS